MRGSSMAELVVRVADMLSAWTCSPRQSSVRACSGFLISINLETISSILCSTQPSSDALFLCLGSSVMHPALHPPPPTNPRSNASGGISSSRSSASSATSCSSRSQSRIDSSFMSMSSASSRVACTQANIRVNHRAPPWILLIMLQLVGVDEEDDGTGDAANLRVLPMQAANLFTA
ncbi:hypothetical protein Taro_055018 [Colocasia esculenta]|uniref:Uncharacterized protein n=1 Tax=Colocasia esculenta TaxID=4460 RepID=A0A843XSB7_COLES|nr:hypothetical protein [Colocasia esculenta]